MTARRRVLVTLLVLMVLGVVLWPSAAVACAVCYGDNSDSGFVRGAQWATVLMVGVTYGMLTGGVALFVILRRRASKATNEDGETHLSGPQSERSPGGFAAGHQGAE